MINEKLVELLKQETKIQKEKLQQKLNEEREIVLMTPVRFVFTETGLLERVSVINTQPYLKYNTELEKEYCTLCGQLVNDDHFIADKEGQKMHVKCYIDSTPTTQA